VKQHSYHLLRQLSDGEFHSGEDLARLSGMTRANVWHSIRALESAGLPVYKVRGRGYRLAQAVSLLDSPAIVRELGAAAPCFNIAVLDEAVSTNTLLLERASAGAPHGSVIAAEWQTGGRGRQGRAWHAAPGGSLTFSLLWRFSQGVGSLAGLSLAAGVALIRALKRAGIDDAGVKWPNDIVWRKRKLAGLLIEVQGDALGPSTAVIGVGLNVRLSKALVGRIDQPVADVETASGEPVDRSALLARLLVELRKALDTFAQRGFAPFRLEWQRSHAYQGKPVRLILPGGQRERGCAAGVGEDGALLLQTAAGMRRYHSGEISLRPATTPAARNTVQRVTRES
jgi:BirA family transcriptional regulator, biotin operon repressor / biotin---[acetyl-CoA-carboxylase] ligase